ncbi:MAG: bleomycin resistance protein [Wohlfahrtiimonas sp.]
MNANTSFAWSKLVPELIVSDITASLKFWVDIIGFNIEYQRIDEGFAYLDLDGAQIMLEQAQEGQWLPAPLIKPFGNGINFQIEVPNLAIILERLSLIDHPLFDEPEEKWYRADDLEHGQRQFLVQDPDGYLLRLVEILGNRPI